MKNIRKELNKKFSQGETDFILNILEKSLNIDWKMLGIQKLDLINTIEDVKEEGVQDNLTGILHLIDSLQDTFYYKD